MAMEGRVRFPRPDAPAFVMCVLALLVPARGWALPGIHCDDERAREGTSGASTVTLKVRLSYPLEMPTTITYRSEDGTATVADGDYDPVAGELTIPAQTTVGTLYVTIHGDTRLEGNEWLRIRLLEAVPGAIADSVAHVTITNDEGTTFEAIGGGGPYYPGTLPTCWGDADGDGIPDLPPYKVQPNGELIAIPGFHDLLAEGNYHGGAWCDYDRDGDEDFMILGYVGVEGGIAPTPSRLLRNDGPAGFIDVAPALGLDVVGSGETPVWADFDGDGWPDLYAPYYTHVAPFTSYLYRNNGDGTFTERAATAGVTLEGVPADLRPEGCQAVDWNDDGHVDLYVASHLFQNDGAGNFTDVRAAAGLPVLFDEGAAMVDYDNDGDFDLYLRTVPGPRLFRNDSGTFAEATATAGLGPVPMFWGDSWADGDGDGDLDLLLVLGDNSTRLMSNQGNGTFERDPFMDAFNPQADFSAWADVDGDGDPDFAMGGNSPWMRVYRNLGQMRPGYAGSHLTVVVLDATGHRVAHGATVRLREIGGPPGTTQTRAVQGGAAFMAQNEYAVHFGGLGSGRYALEVVYPSPEGQRIVVDSLTNPVLGSIEPASMTAHVITVYPDGGIQMSGQQSVAGVPGMSSRSGDLLGMPVPSPARTSMRISLHGEHAGDVAVTILDVAGRRVRSFVLDAARQAAVLWDLRDEAGAPVPSGVYVAHATGEGGRRGNRRLLVIR